MKSNLFFNKIVQGYIKTVGEYSLEISIDDFPFEVKYVFPKQECMLLYGDENFYYFMGLPNGDNSLLNWR